jgi:hypothetical protein
MERSDTQPEEVTSVNTEINTFTDRAEDPVNEAPTRDVQTFWSRLDTLVTHLEGSGLHKSKDKLHSFTNQPERVCISSDSDINTSQTQNAISEQAFNSFRVAIQRPFLNVKTIQLLRASIPNTVTNIPDEECTFWYYRLPVATFSGTLSVSISGVAAYTNATFTTSGVITPASTTSYGLLSISPGFPNAGIVTYYTVSLAGLSVGSSVTISGVSPAGYNGTFVVAIISIPNLSFSVVNSTTATPSLSASAAWKQSITDYIDWSTVPYSLKSYTGGVRGYFTYPTSSGATVNIYQSNTLTGVTIGTITRSGDLYMPIPSSKYLKMVRLLPSYYKPELFDTDRGQNVSPPPASPYGWNRTFTDYPDLASELAKSCAADPAYDFATQQATTFRLFIPDDISITYNSTLNKFCLTGNNSYSGGIKYASYLSAGFNDNNLWELPTGNITAAVVSGNFIIYTTTTSTSTLYPGLLVSIKGFSTEDDGYNGVYYISSFTSTTFTVADAFPPGSPVSTTNFKQTSWITLPNGAAYLAAITSGSFGLQSYDHTLIFGVGGQPFQLYRSLNLRLGFTWNGLVTQIAGYFPLDITTLTAQSIGTSILATFLNRLRPVPFYYTFSALDTGLSDSPYTSLIYTADSYANLVNTNTVSLYADFTGGSTYDSIANTQLLACVPMNASNLGVTFYNTTLYCPLTKISDQIYEIEIRMLTDTGAPYVIPNSAIVSLELALTY